MKIAAIILSNTKDAKFFGLATDTINTLTQSNEWEGDIYLIETQSKQYLEDNNFKYDCNVVHPGCEFNYNKFLNIGIAAAKSTADWFLICNNDIQFTKDWLVETKNVHNKFTDISSFSFFEPDYHSPWIEYHNQRLIHTGYSLVHICGWCILVSKECVANCDLFDERFPMYHQDNDYAFTIYSSGFKHALLFAATVNHIGSQSHSIVPNSCITDGNCKLLMKKFPDLIPDEHFIGASHLGHYLYYPASDETREANKHSLISY